VVLLVLRNVAAAALYDLRKEEIATQPIRFPSNLIKSPLILHLNRSLMGAELFLQIQRPA
jgi:hypothetical protein